MDEKLEALEQGLGDVRDAIWILDGVCLDEGRAEFLAYVLEQLEQSASFLDDLVAEVRNETKTPA